MISLISIFTKKLHFHIYNKSALTNLVPIFYLLENKRPVISLVFSYWLLILVNVYLIYHAAIYVVVLFNIFSNNSAPCVKQFNVWIMRSISLKLAPFVTSWQFLIHFFRIFRFLFVLMCIFGKFLLFFRQLVSKMIFDLHLFFAFY